MGAREEQGIASAAAVGPPPGMKVRLSSNESPFGPAAGVVEAVGRLAADLHLYPDDQSASLRETIAEHEGVPVERVAVGNGSAALLMDLVAHECRRGGGVVTFDRAFIVYRLAAQVVEAGYEEVDAGKGFARDPDALLARVDGTTRVVLVDNPGNPTGAHLTGAELRALVEGLPEQVTVGIDEAYHQFASGYRGYETVADLGLEHPRLVVFRTFSKAYALAGARVGYVVGPPDLVRSLDTDRERFNLSAVAQVAAAAALADQSHLERTVTGTVEGRARMADALAELGVPFADGLGNFLTIELGEPSGRVIEAYARHGVGVRELHPYRLPDHIRVTVGTPEEVDTFLEVSREALAGVASRGR